MPSAEETLARLRRFNETVRGVEPEYAIEAAVRGRPSGVVEASVEDQIDLESIVLRSERPVIVLRADKPVLTIADDSQDGLVWKARLEAATPAIEAAARAVGRIELQGGYLDWVGTGWVVDDGVLVTNRHVAELFAHRNGEGVVFRAGESGSIQAACDFLQEIDNDQRRVFRLRRPLHIEDAEGPDMAFFEIEKEANNDQLAAPIGLASQTGVTANAAVIGYPAFDSRIPDLELMERIYGRLYNKKRLAPGGVTSVRDTTFLHDCTTLGGNSGSVVLSLDNGDALGLHFSGGFLTSNYAVRAEAIRTRLDDLRRGRRARRSNQPPPVRSEVAVPGRTVSSAIGAGEVLRLTLPITVTVSVGEPLREPSGLAAPAVASGSRQVDVSGEEGRAEDYASRVGYDPTFLGIPVAMPRIIRDADDVLTERLDGKAEPELHYQNFSVILSASRRMCFLSACNIDGGASKKSARVGWKWDPRIARKYQIMNECYGSPPRFSRGHMTRREDPGWGDAEKARLGNEDSMHVTNVVPQMQAFNSPIWLGLEDYALQHARQDKMRISVFTGAYFSEADPILYGVRIPTEFWKVIAFIHDETEELCVTGYEMSQAQTLPSDREFVFGAYTSPQINMATQVSINSIERKSGVSFNNLASYDAFSRRSMELPENEVGRRLFWASNRSRFLD